MDNEILQSWKVRKHCEEILDESIQKNLLNKLNKKYAGYCNEGNGCHLKILV